jgi:hypothetical protein
VREADERTKVVGLSIFQPLVEVAHAAARDHSTEPLEQPWSTGPVEGTLTKSNY